MADNHPCRIPRTSSPDEIAHGSFRDHTRGGTLLWLRVYHRYARAAGIHRIGHQLDSTFNRAGGQSIRGGALEQSTEDQVGQIYRTVWLRDKTVFSPETTWTSPQRKNYHHLENNRRRGSDHRENSDAN